MKQDRSRRVLMNAAEGSWREVVEKKRCLERLCGDLERKVGWKFSGNGGRRDFVDFGGFLAEGYLVLDSNHLYR